MRIDIHVHSKFSTRPSQWLLQKLGCPESFTQPRALYDIARGAGMDMVTISDHNTIAGSLEIAHLPGAFVSEEITTYFPEDRCKVHVLALNIDEEIHREVQRLRENIFELVPYLRGKGVTHVCAHPLFAVNDRLTPAHFEELLLLFKNFECNGTRDGYQNDMLRHILRSLTPQAMQRLSELHGIAPDFPEPWKKNLTGGSDDHSGMNIASMHTRVKGVRTLASFLRGIDEGRSEPEGRYASPRTMAHNLYAIAYQFYKSRFGLERYVAKDIFLRFVDAYLCPEPPRESRMVDRVQAWLQGRRYQRSSPAAGSVQELVRFEAARLIGDDPEFRAVGKGLGQPGKLPENEWFRFLTEGSNRVLTVFADHLLGHVAHGNVFDIFHTVGSAGALYTVLAPYFIGYGLFTKDRAFTDEVAARFLPECRAPREREAKVGHFTDTFFEVNGVAKTLQHSVRLANSTGKDLTVITCAPDDRDHGPGVRNFKPIGVYDLPEYPGLSVYYPPVLSMLDYAYEQNFTHIHSATPGPIGLTALLVARILKLPVYGTYHTQIPQYVGKLTDDTGMEDMSWKFMLWYYSQMDLVFAPSQATAVELIQRGLPAEKIRIYPRGVDIRRFTPEKRNGFLKRYRVTDGPTLLYVGRISREKNLDLLAEAFRRVSRRHPSANLVLCGDGPHRAELERALKGTRATFTGYLEGEELAALYASADLFVFPSRTDTFGNVVLEAQASGIPVVVTSEGGPQENVVHGETGFIVDGQDASELTAVLDMLLANPQRLRELGAKAREAMEQRSFERAFETAWTLQYDDAAA